MKLLKADLVALATHLKITDLAKTKKPLRNQIIRFLIDDEVFDKGALEFIVTEVYGDRDLTLEKLKIEALCDSWNNKGSI